MNNLDKVLLTPSEALASLERKRAERGVASIDKLPPAEILETLQNCSSSLWFCRFNAYTTRLAARMGLEALRQGKRLIGAPKYDDDELATCPADKYQTCGLWIE